MVDIRVFKKTDLAGCGMVAHVIEGGETVSEPGYAYTLEAAGKPLACVGVRTVWTGVGEAWAVVAKEFKDHPSAFRKVRDLLELVQIRGCYQRIHAFVPCGFDAGLRFVEHLGFRRETGRLDKFFPWGDGAFLYVRW